MQPTLVCNLVYLQSKVKPEEDASEPASIRSQLASYVDEASFQFSDTLPGIKIARGDSKWQYGRMDVEDLSVQKG